jgi:hypothetical protein
VFDSHGSWACESGKKENSEKVPCDAERIVGKKGLLQPGGSGKSLHELREKTS